MLERVLDDTGRRPAFEGVLAEASERAQTLAGYDVAPASLLTAPIIAGQCRRGRHRAA